MAAPAPADRAGRTYEKARAACGGLPLDRTAFDAAWVRAGDPASTGSSADRRAADVYLAAACDAGIPGAWDAIAEGYAPRLRALLRKQGVREAAVDESVADLWGYLCEPPPDGRARTRLGTYDGSGSLFSWLAVLVLRRRQALSAPRPGTEGGLGDDVPASRPGRAAGHEETVARFRAAIRAGLDSLTDRERLALLLKHRDGLRGREIAKILRVGEPRVSRLLDAAVRRLEEAVRLGMPGTPPGTATPDRGTWDSLTAVLARHLATSLPPADDSAKEADDRT
jgi:RNA polymerase sigma factor (sigma-70 family)